MGLIRKSLLVDARSVTVDTTKTVDENGNAIFEVTATCGKSTVTSRYAIQPNSGLSAVQLQADLDGFRARCAKEAAGKENVAEVSGLVI